MEQVAVQDPVELRKDRRMEFFLVPVEREQVPVWIFKPSAPEDAIAGLVLNLSKGGLQVLISAHAELSSERYDMRLLLGEADGVPQFSAQVQRVWQRELTKFGTLHGLQFLTERSPAEQFLARYGIAPEAHQWVRCLLVPQAN